ncbi:high affinity methionine permease [Lyophyllum atratum]|nr:high affinity methionine permease [Lyophyllum atratum]
MSSEDTEKKQSVDEKYVIETPSTESLPSYEEAAVTTGAPVEKVSPLGYRVDSITVVFLNINKMIGTGGLLAGSILKAVGSVGLSLIFWVIGYAFAGASLAVYLEYASYFPQRSGAEVAYLEKAYPKPKFLLPTAFAVQSVLLSFSSSNAIVLAKYLLIAGGGETTTWNVRGLAVGAFTVIVIICIASTKWSLRLSNAIGVVKLVTLIFIAITGLVVLGGHTRVEDPQANFRNSFAGTASNGNGLATALVKVNFAYSGFENAFNVLNEVRNPVRTMKRYAPLSLTIVFLLYLFANIAYFAAIPKEEIRASKELTASLFFVAVFGNSKSVTALSALVAVSSFGNLLSGIIGSCRIIRECGRQGVLPYPRFWASTKPFNTPFGPYLLKWLLTVIVIIAPPAGDAFNFSKHAFAIVDLQSYPANVFSFLTTLGLFFVRKRRASIGAPPTEFRAWNAVLIFALAVNIYLLVLPWIPPQGGIYAGDVTFFYATYCIVGIAILVISGLAYVVWIQILPKIKGLAIRQLTERLDDGAHTNKLVRVHNSKLAEWDATHDEHGEVIERTRGAHSHLRSGHDLL